MPETIFIGCPSYNHLLHSGAAAALYQYPSQKRQTIPCVTGRANPSPNCNALLCAAVNEHRKNRDVRWFAMLHADVAPEPWWVDKLIDEAEEHKADFVSAVVPLKNHTGLVSTAIATHNLADRFGRLTLRQIHHPRFPKTFGINEAVDALAQLPDDLRVNAPRTMLLHNTGCMVLRLGVNVDWSKVAFAVVDGIVDQGGELRFYDIPEDWTFTARLTLAGAKCMGTKAVKVVHHGAGEFGNDKAWGTIGREMDGIVAG